MNRSSLLRLTPRLLPLALALATAGCHRSPSATAPEKLPAAAVKIAPLQSQGRLATEDIVGTVRAKLRATLAAKVSGRIETLPVRAGQAVKAGDLIAQLDLRETQARLDQARAVRDQADRDRQRFADLLKQNAVAPQENDAKESQFRVADAVVKETEALLSYARVTAPFPGVITRKLAEAGDLASPGRALVELEDPATLQVEADVPEALVEHLTIGTAATVVARETAPAIAARVVEVAPAADLNTRTVHVKLEVPATAGLRLGQFVRLRVPTARTEAARVPRLAVVVRGQMEIVFVVTNQVAQLRLVKTGRQTGDEVDLLSGVAPGELIVVEGATSLQDGQPVTVRP